MVVRDTTASGLRVTKSLSSHWSQHVTYLAHENNVKIPLVSMEKQFVKFLIGKELFNFFSMALTRIVSLYMLTM